VNVRFTNCNYVKLMRVFVEGNRLLGMLRAKVQTLMKTQIVILTDRKIETVVPLPNALFDFDLSNHRREKFNYKLMCTKGTCNFVLINYNLLF
jgi:hypothetical protein